MSKLATKKCIPCQGGVPPIGEKARKELLLELPNWKIVNDHHLYREYSFANYEAALSWVNTISEIAEEHNHHPDIELGWGYVRVSIWTHKIDNLCESDFILAANIDLQDPQLPKNS